MSVFIRALACALGLALALLWTGWSHQLAAAAQLTTPLWLLGLAAGHGLAAARADALRRPLGTAALAIAGAGGVALAVIHLAAPTAAAVTGLALLFTALLAGIGLTWMARAMSGDVHPSLTLGAALGLGLGPLLQQQSGNEALLAGAGLLLLTLAILMAAAARQQLPVPLPLRLSATHPRQLWQAAERGTVSTWVALGSAVVLLETGWQRALGVALGPTAGLTAALGALSLLGLALGGLLGGRSSAAAGRSPLALALTLVAAAALMSLSGAQIDTLPARLSSLLQAGPNGPPSAMLAAALRGLLIASCVLPASLALGATLPLSLRLALPPALLEEDRLGQLWGSALAILTASAGLCAALAPHLLALLGVDATLRLAASLLALAALRLLTVSAADWRRPLRPLATAFALVTLYYAWARPVWDVAAWTSGDASAAAGSLLLAHRDGLLATITVEVPVTSSAIRMAASARRQMKVDGQAIAVAPGGELDPLQLLRLALLAHPQPRRLAVLGGAAALGMASAWPPMVEQIWIFEPEPAIWDAAPALLGQASPFRFGPPVVQPINAAWAPQRPADGAPYDVVLAAPPHLNTAAGGAATSSEFYAAAAAALAPDGLLIQALPAAPLTLAQLQGLLQGMRAALPHLLLLQDAQAPGMLLALASQSPLALTWPELQRRAARLRGPLRAPPATLAGILASDGGSSEVASVDLPLRALIGILATDADLPAPETGATARAAGDRWQAGGTWGEIAVEGAPTRLAGAAHGQRLARLLPLLRGPDTDDVALALALAPAFVAAGQLEDAAASLGLLQALAQAEGGGHHAAAALALSQLEEVSELLAIATQPEHEPVIDLAQLETDPEFARAVHLYMDGDELAALAYLEQHAAVVHRNGLHLFFYGYLLYRQGSHAAAEAALLQAEAQPDTEAARPALAYYRGRCRLAAGDGPHGVQLLRRYLAFESAPAPQMQAED